MYAVISCTFHNTYFLIEALSLWTFRESLASLFADDGGAPGNHYDGVAGKEVDLPVRHERHQGRQPHPHARQERLQADASQGEYGIHCGASTQSWYFTSIFDMSCRPVGWYCSYWAAHLVTGTSYQKQNKTLWLSGRPTVYVSNKLKRACQVGNLYPFSLARESSLERGGLSRSFSVVLVQIWKFLLKKQTPRQGTNFPESLSAIRVDGKLLNLE